MTNYKLGARKEYKIVEALKKEGYTIVQRSAGSHSPIDVWAIDRYSRTIKLIQCKRTLSETMDYIEPSLKKKIEKEMGWLQGNWEVIFEAR